MQKIRFSVVTVMLCIAGLALSTGARAAGDAAAGKAKSQVCAACHGADGNSVNPVWPSLAGQHAEYLEKQLHDFHDGARKNDQMSPMAAPLSNQDIADLAAYFSTQTPKKGAAAPESISAGQSVYRAGDAQTGLAACMACHGPDGAGNPAAKYPRLSGQHAEYTAAQLRAFKTEDRSNDPNGMMQSIASRLTNADIDAVSHYIQGLH